MLRRLKIHRFRNVAPGTELVFSDGVQVLLGPNGGGKTTLLELIAMAIRGDFSAIEQEEYELEYAVGEGELEVDVRLAHRRERPAEAAAVGYLRWHDDFAVQLRTSGRAWSCRTESEDVVLTPPDRTAVRAPKHPWAEWKQVVFEMLSMGGINIATAFAVVAARASVRFDETLLFFSWLRGGERFGGDPLSLRVDQDGRQIVPVQSSPGSGRLHDRFSAAASDVRNPQILALSSRTNDALREAVELLHFRHGEYRAELTREDPSPEGVVRRYERFSFRFERRDGTHVLGDYLSFGQKRLVAFLMYLELLAPGTPVVADELVDGMHYRWVQRCLELLRGRQAFLSSQSPLLMDFLTFASAEEVRRAFVLCTSELVDERERLVWRNLTEEEATTFFQAYEVGIQHVSEILRDRGLW